MKKLVYGTILVVLVFLSRPAWAASATEADIPAIFFQLDGESLSQADMEDILGGLPRCCHLSNYDNIEDKCLNNKGQSYLAGENDCDIWIENVLNQGGIDIASRWGSAKNTSIRDHRQRIVKQLRKTQPKGWSIMIIDASHAALTKLNDDGSIDIYHQGQNLNSDGSTTWESRGHHYNNKNEMGWKGSIEYWAIN